MYILKNAFTNIVRNKGRNLLIGIIILVLSTSIAVTLAINNTSNNLINSYKEKYQTEATIGVNRENVMKEFNPGEKPEGEPPSDESNEESKENIKNKFSEASNLSEDDIKNFADSKYVKSYYYTISTSTNAKDIEKASSTTNSNDKGPGRREEESSADYSIKGYSSLDAMTEFIEGNYEITDGSANIDFENNECLISNELATLNSISVGDTITLTDPNNEETTYELTVKGIYKEKESTDNNQGMNMFSNSANTIITNITVVNNLKDKFEDLNTQVSPTFVLTSSSVVEKFSEELTSKGLSEYLSVQTNLDQVESATSSISNVKSFAVTFMVITVIIGVIVLFILNMINIRERKYEIGVLRTIGMKKKDVCFQFLSELIIVSLAGLVLGAGLGACISVPVSNNLLKNEISSSTSQQDDISKNFGERGNKDFGGGMKFSGVTQVQAFDSIDAVVDIKVLGELLLIGIVITIISGTSAVVSIQRFQPLTILKERS